MFLILDYHSKIKCWGKFSALETYSTEIVGDTKRFDFPENSKFPNAETTGCISSINI